MPQRRRMGACRTFCHGPATNETVDASAFPICGTYGGLVRREAGQHFFFSGTHGGRVRKYEGHISMACRRTHVALLLKVRVCRSFDQSKAPVCPTSMSPLFLESSTHMTTRRTRATKWLNLNGRVLHLSNSICLRKARPSSSWVNDHGMQCHFNELAWDRVV